MGKRKMKIVKHKDSNTRGARALSLALRAWAKGERNTRADVLALVRTLQADPKEAFRARAFTNLLKDCEDDNDNDASLASALKDSAAITLRTRELGFAWSGDDEPTAELGMEFLRKMVDSLVEQSKNEKK
jgi:hypothetical protein